MGNHFVGNHIDRGLYVFTFQPGDPTQERLGVDLGDVCHVVAQGDQLACFTQGEKLLQSAQQLEGLKTWPPVSFST